MINSFSINRPNRSNGLRRHATTLLALIFSSMLTACATIDERDAENENAGSDNSGDVAIEQVADVEVGADTLPPPEEIVRSPSRR